MINQIIGVILMSISGTLQGMAMEHMIDKKSEKSTPVGRVLYWTIWGIILSSMNVFADKAVETQTIRQILYWASTFAALIFFYKDPLWRKFLAMILLFFAFTMSEFGNYFAIQFQGISVEVLQDRTTDISIIYIGIGSILSCVSILILLALWQKAFKKGIRLKYTWFIIAYAFVQFINQNIMTNSIYNSNMRGSEVGVLSLGIICIIVLLFTVFSQVEKQAMEEHLLEERIRSNLEKAHYDEVNKRRNQVKKVLKTYKKELYTVKELLNEHQIDESGYILKSMLKQIEETKEIQFCEIPVVNALLMEKQKECNIYGIGLYTEICISEKMAIRKMDLCSIVGNLMDNAIRACKKVVEANQENGNVEIRMVTGVRNGYLIMKCENPTLKMSEHKVEGTGYGLKILREIAERYHGDFQTQYDEKRFVSQISLRI